MTPERKIARLEAALRECETYFEARADVVDGSVPNEEMRLLTEIREALGERP